MKYIIEIPDDVQYVLFNGKADNKYYTAVRPVAELEVLNSDYINEHYGELQDEAYQRGFEDGKKSVSDPDRIEVGDEVEAAFGTAVVTYIEEGSVGYLYSTGTTGFDEPRNVKKTGKHYDIQSILEAMRE